MKSNIFLKSFSSQLQKESKTDNLIVREIDDHRKTDILQYQNPPSMLTNKQKRLLLLSIFLLLIATISDRSS